MGVATLVDGVQAMSSVQGLVGTWGRRLTVWEVGEASDQLDPGNTWGTRGLRGRKSWTLCSPFSVPLDSPWPQQSEGTRVCAGVPVQGPEPARGTRVSGDAVPISGLDPPRM